MADGSLEYQFKVDVPTAPLKAGADHVDKLTKSMEHLDHQGGRHAESLEHKIRHSAGGIGHAVEYAKHEIKDLLEVLGLMVAFEIGEKLLHRVIEFGEEALTAAAAAERMDLAFKLSLGDAGGEEMVSAFERIAGHTEFTETQLKGWGKQLLNAGVAAEDLDKFMAAGLDVAAKSPDKLEGMGKAIQALTRANLTGSVDMRQLRGLSIGIDQLRTLPKFANMSAKQLKKELTDGKLTKEDLLSVIAGPDKILGDLGIKAGKTLEARLTHLKSLPEEIFAKLRHTEAFDHVSEAIGHMLEKLDPDGPMMQKIVEGLGGVLDKFGDLIDGIDFDTVIGGVAGFIEALKEALEVTIKIGKAVADISGVSDFVKQIGETHRRGQELADAKKAILEGHEVARNKTTIELGLAPRGELVKPGVRAWHGAFNMVGEAAGDGAAAGMDKSQGKVKDAAGEMAGVAPPAAKAVLKARSPSVVFEDIGGMAAAGFADGIAGGGDMVSDAVNEMLRIPRAAGAPSGGGAGGGMTVTIGRVDVHVSGGATEEDGRAAARGMAEELRPAFVDLMEQVRAEMGA